MASNTQKFAPVGSPQFNWWWMQKNRKKRDLPDVNTSNLVVSNDNLAIEFKDNKYLGVKS